MHCRVSTLWRQCHDWTVFSTKSLSQLAAVKCGVASKATHNFLAPLPATRVCITTTALYSDQSNNNPKINFKNLKSRIGEAIKNVVFGVYVVSEWIWIIRRSLQKSKHLFIQIQVCQNTHLVKLQSMGKYNWKIVLLFEFCRLAQC